VKLLLGKGAELESKDEDGRTPPSVAAEKRHEVVVLEKGAEMETKGNDGCTLSWAVGNGHEAVVKLLLKKGADLGYKDEEYGQTPLSLAAENRHEAVVKLPLERGGVNLKSKDYIG
jgi:hypothetical protein